MINTELEITRRISHAASTGTDSAATIEQIALLALKLKGIRQVRIDWADPGEPTTWASLAGAPACQTASVPVAVDGKEHGSLCLHFDAVDSGIQNVGRFATFLGEQIGAVMERERLERRSQELAGHAAKLRDDLAARKAFDRARGILVERHGIPESQAAEMLRRYAWQAGKSPREVADALIAANSPTFRYGGRVHIHRRIA